MQTHQHFARPQAVLCAAISAGLLVGSGAWFPAAGSPPVNTVVATISGFDYPVGLAISGDGNKVYVANEGSSDTVSVVDTSSNQITGTFMNGGHTAFELALTPDGQTLYVADADEVGWQYAYGTITIINTTTGASTDVVTHGATPEGLALSPDGTTLWIADTDASDYAPSMMDFLDVATGTLSAPVDSYGFPEYIVFLPDNRAYISSLDGLVEIFDVTTRKRQRKFIQVGSESYGICLSPRENTAYVLNAGFVYLNTTPTISVINTNTDEVVNTINLPATPGVDQGGRKMALTSDGKYLYVPVGPPYISGGGQGNVFVVNTKTGNVVGDPIPVGDTPVDVAITPSGQYAYVTNEGDGTVTVIQISE